jgi:hypothetical protein
MNMQKTYLLSLLTVGICLVFMTGATTSKIKPSENNFSFDVLADPRSKDTTWKHTLLAIRDRNTNPEASFTPSELILVVGDMGPLASRHEEYKHVFTNASTHPVFLPVIGNHEFSNFSVGFQYARDVLVPAIPRVVCQHVSSCDYYVDYKNARIIVVDGYSKLGKEGVINDKGRQWVEQVIKTAPPTIDHIFISFHEPAFPRSAHIGESFDQDPIKRNAFWNMLVQYKDRVHAVFVGHTHVYCRMRILDPAGVAANDPQAFPNEEGGIYQVNAGADGVTSIDTIIQVQVEGKNVHFSALQTKKGEKEPFVEVDKWSLLQKP